MEFENIGRLKMVSAQFRKKKKKKMQSRHFVVGRPENFNLLADISFGSRLQNVVLLSLLLFLCACYSTDLDNVK